MTTEATEVLTLEPGTGPGRSDTCAVLVYRPATRELVVEYRHPGRDGCAVYSYREITREMWVACVTADRPGTWLRRTLAATRWPYDRLRGWAFDAALGDFVSGRIGGASPRSAP